MKSTYKQKGKQWKRLIQSLLGQINWLYFAIGVMILIGIAFLLFSWWIIDSDLKNIMVGIGTGIVTSSLVSLFIDISNRKLEGRKLVKYKTMLLNPLYNVVRALYIQICININEYRVRNEYQGYLFLPNDPNKEMSEYFKNLKTYKIDEIGEAEKKSLNKMLYISEASCRELISLFKGFPLDSLLFENVITFEEYGILKNYNIVDVLQGNISKLAKGAVLEQEQEEYEIRIQTIQGILFQINRILKAFPDMAQKIEYENKWIKDHLDEVYYNEVYTNSDEYIEQMVERMEAEAEYYAEHPEELQPIEETEEDELHRKINEAIWAEDAETIKECFPQIDKNDKVIQSELTWNVAKNVMKDKELRRLYQEKYGVKYKIRKK